MKQGKTSHSLSLIALGIFAISDIALAETGCAFEPFTTTISQGESATISVVVALPVPAASYELDLGNLPSSVRGGFTQAGNAGTGSVKKSSLLIQSNPDAQTGSFMIPVLCRISTRGSITESINQFNLVVRRGVEATPASSQGTQSAASPILQSILQSVSSGASPPAASSALKETFSRVTNATSTAALKTLPASASTSPSFISPGIIISNLQRGSRGAQVTLLQQILQKLNFFPKDMEPTGYFGPITEEAVREFQKNKNLETVGLVGPKTRKILGGLAR